MIQCQSTYWKPSHSFISYRESIFVLVSSSLALHRVSVSRIFTSISWSGPYQLERKNVRGREKDPSPFIAWYLWVLWSFVAVTIDVVIFTFSALNFVPSFSLSLSLLVQFLLWICGGVLSVSSFAQSTCICV